jgi:hypothetical protein
MVNEQKKGGWLSFRAGDSPPRLRRAAYAGDAGLPPARGMMATVREPEVALRRPGRFRVPGMLTRSLRGRRLVGDPRKDITCDQTSCFH